MTNCVNCGAPVYLHRETCPYCDSPYMDVKLRHGYGTEIDTFKRLSIEKAELEGEILKSKIKVQADIDRMKVLYARALESMRKYAY